MAHRAGFFTLAGCTLGCALTLGLAPAYAANLEGHVLSGERPQAGLEVSLFAADGTSDDLTLLGSDQSDEVGRFEIDFNPPEGESVLYLVAKAGPVALASALGTAPVPASVIVNERTTVATAYALAQFIEAGSIGGPSPGLQNAAAMAQNLVDITTGGVSAVLASPPNGTETSALPTFNSLANLIAACVRAERRCPTLFERATPPASAAPDDTFQAVANIARNPWLNVERLYLASVRPPNPYAPARLIAPNAWTLELRFEGDRTINGPGNFAIDEDGNVWVNDNYQPGGRLESVCAGLNLYKFTPTGDLFPDAPYTGGGLSGAGYGITLDPDGHVWVGNFGFQAPACVGTPEEAENNSVSEFLPSGVPLSPEDGYTAGDISWPQGTVSDQRGSIWLANCGNDSVTLYPNGNPANARNFDDIGLDKPFDIAIDQDGHAWVTGNQSSSVAVLDQRGRLIKGSPFSGGGINRPMGIASDSQGNMWVANSQIVDVPCPGIKRPDSEIGGTVTLIRNDGEIAPGSPFAGGGMAIPWGIAVDGNDTVWVSSFGGGAGEGGSLLSRISQICGTDPGGCPAGLETGDPISPPTGYTSDALQRVTAVQIDPSGNVWATNNWKLIPLQNNPGGTSIVVFIGIAAPIATPLIGPPVPAIATR